MSAASPSPTLVVTSFVSLLGSGCVERAIVDGELASSGPDAADEVVDEACDPACSREAVCVVELCLPPGELYVVLRFEADTDLDLHLRRPDGRVLTFLDAENGGEEWFFYADECRTNECSGATARGEAFVLFDEAMRGTYTAQVVNWSGKAAADYSLHLRGAIEVQLTGQVSEARLARGPEHEFVW